MREKGLFYKQVKEAEGRGSLEGHEGLGWLGLGSGMVAVPGKWGWNRAGPAPMWSMAEMTSHHRPHHHQFKFKEPGPGQSLNFSQAPTVAAPFVNSRE